MDAPRFINIAVQSLSGDLLCEPLKANPAGGIINLKRRLEKLVHVPVQCQRVILDGDMLNDHATLLKVCEGQADGFMVSITLIVSLGAIIQDFIGRSDHASRKKSFDSLRKFGAHAKAVVWDVLLDCLQHPDDHKLRSLAIHAVPKLVPKGDEQAIAAVSACVTDANSKVCADAFGVLGQLVNKDDDYFIELTRSFLQIRTDVSSSVKKTAMHALAAAVTPGNQKACDIVVECLGDTESGVACCALETLAEMSVEGNEQVIDAWISCLMTGIHEDLKLTAVEVARDVVGDNLSRAVAAILHGIRSANWQAAKYLMFALAKLGEDDACTFEEIRACLADRSLDPHTRAAAVEALGAMCDSWRGYNDWIEASLPHELQQAALSDILECFADPQEDECLRKEAIESLECLARNEVAMNAICDCVKDQRQPLELRKKGVKSLCRLLHYLSDTSHIAHLLLASCKDPEESCDFRAEVFYSLFEACDASANVAKVPALQPFIKANKGAFDPCGLHEHQLTCSPSISHWSVCCVKGCTGQQSPALFECCKSPDCSFCVCSKCYMKAGGSIVRRWEC